MASVTTPGLPPASFYYYIGTIGEACFSMKIQRKVIGETGLFYIGEDGNHQAEMNYHEFGDNSIVIDGTEVKESLRGQGVGMKLVDAAVDFARQKNLKIVPECPFVKSAFKKREEIRDVLKQ